MADLIYASEDFPVYAREGVELSHVLPAAKEFIAATFDTRPIRGRVRRFVATAAFANMVAIREGVNIDENVESYTPPSLQNVANNIIQRSLEQGLK